MELVFDKERSEHKKLLTDSQQMAEGLKAQLTESETKRASENKELQAQQSARQLEWEAERDELEARIAQVRFE